MISGLFNDLQSPREQVTPIHLCSLILVTCSRPEAALELELPLRRAGAGWGSPFAPTIGIPIEHRIHLTRQRRGVPLVFHQRPVIAFRLNDLQAPREAAAPPVVESGARQHLVARMHRSK